MEIKDVFIKNINLIKSIDKVIDSLIKNNISYVLIKEENYMELHFLDSIYRFFISEELSLIDSCNLPLTQHDELELINSFNKEIADYKNSKLFVDKDILTTNKRKKERPGFKRYTKKDMKKDRSKFNIRGR